MTPTKTPFRNLIFFLRVAAGLLGTAAFALCIPIFNNGTSGWYSGEIAATAFPIISGGILLLWNIISIIIMFKIQKYQVLLAIGDLLIFGVATGIGVIGFYHDNTPYLNDSDQWNNSSLEGEQIGAVMLLIAVILQILLVVINYLEYRYLKKASRRVSLPPYSGYQHQPVVVEHKDDFELDWRSVVSEKALENEVKKPVSAVV